ncbi:hypothetical protein KCU93_g113, partial [Aureobasidium melanogenum]
MLVLGFFHDWASAQNELRVEKRLWRSALSRASLSAACSAALVARSEVPENVFLCIGTTGLGPLIEELLGAPLRRFAFFGVCAVCSTSSSSSLPNDGNGFGAGVAHRLLLPLLKVQNMKLPRKVPSAPEVRKQRQDRNRMCGIVVAVVERMFARACTSLLGYPQVQRSFSRHGSKTLCWSVAVCPSARILLVLAGKNLEALAYMDPLQCKSVPERKHNPTCHDMQNICSPTSCEDNSPRRRDTPEKLMYHSDLKKSPKTRYRIRLDQDQRLVFPVSDADHHLLSSEISPHHEEPIYSDQCTNHTETRRDSDSNSNCSTPFCRYD